MGAPESFILGDFTVAQCSRCLKTPLGNGESYFGWSVKASLGRIFRAANWPCISIQKDRELGDLLLFVYMLPKIRTKNHIQLIKPVYARGPRGT